MWRRSNVFCVRYEVHTSILFKRYSVFKGFSFFYVWLQVKVQYQCLVIPLSADT
jgi:hypothetical protein